MNAVALKHARQPINGTNYMIKYNIKKINLVEIVLFIMNWKSYLQKYI